MLSWQGPLLNLLGSLMINGAPAAFKMLGDPCHAKYGSIMCCFIPASAVAHAQTTVRRYQLDEAGSDDEGYADPLARPLVRRSAGVRDRESAEF